MKLSAKPKKFDYFFVSLVFLLIVFGLVMLASASSNIGQTKFNDSYYYLKHQIIYGLSFGLIGFLVTSKIYYRRLEKAAFIFLIISLVLLISVFSPMGISAGGARRWLSLGTVTFQPSEIVKFTFIVYLAAWLSKNKDRALKFFSGFLPLFSILAAISLVLLYQRSTSTACIILLTALLVYFVSGAKLKFILYILLLLFLILPIIFYFSSYRWERIKTFLNPQRDPLGRSFHLNQALLAIGSGQLWGRGYGQSTIKIYYLPEPTTDSIFAVIAEELGFVGAFSLIIVFFLFVWRSIYIASKNSDTFAKLLAVGFGSLIGIQTFIHIAAISGVIPLTGVPLPFISYGGTALAAFLTMSGVIVNISKYS